MSQKDEERKFSQFDMRRTKLNWLLHVCVVCCRRRPPLLHDDDDDDDDDDSCENCWLLHGCVASGTPRVGAHCSRTAPLGGQPSQCRLRTSWLWSIKTTNITLKMGCTAYHHRLSPIKTTNITNITIIKTIGCTAALITSRFPTQTQQRRGAG